MKSIVSFVLLASLAAGLMMQVDTAFAADDEDDNLICVPRITVTGGGIIPPGGGPIVKRVTVGALNRVLSKLEQEDPEAFEIVVNEFKTLDTGLQEAVSEELGVDFRAEGGFRFGGEEFWNRRSELEKAWVIDTGKLLKSIGTAIELQGQTLTVDDFNSESVKNMENLAQGLKITQNALETRARELNGLTATDSMIAE